MAEISNVLKTSYIHSSHAAAAPFLPLPPQIYMLHWDFLAFPGFAPHIRILYPNSISRYPRISQAVIPWEGHGGCLVSESLGLCPPSIPPQAPLDHGATYQSRLIQLPSLQKHYLIILSFSNKSFATHEVFATVRFGSFERGLGYS